MKNLFLAALISTTASANPFDAFVGEYKTVGAPLIRNQNAKECNRFDFKNITGLKVEKDTSGYKQSHMVYVLTSSGRSGLAVMEYAFDGDLGTGGSYAKTSGNSTTAYNEFGTRGTNPSRNETLAASVEKSAAGYTFKLTEALYEPSTTLTASCHYSVLLTKN
ncbi:hypothetical protein K2X33_11405 [bacterium]|nr:hypothetical protein [bacterium]